MNIWNYQETLFIFSWALAVKYIDEQVTTGLVVKLEWKRGEIREKLKHTGTTPLQSFPPKWKKEEVTLIQIRGGEWSHFKKFISLENIHYFHLMRTLKQKYLYFFALKMANNTLILQLVVQNHHFLFNSEILEGFIPSQNVPNFLHFPSFV